MARADTSYVISVYLFLLVAIISTLIALTLADVCSVGPRTRVSGLRRKLSCTSSNSDNVLGVNWGQYFINDSPSASLVVQSIISYGFSAVKLYGVLNYEAVSALANTGIQVTIAVDGALLQNLAGGNGASTFNHVSSSGTGVASCQTWLVTNVVAPLARGVQIRHVVVGNEPDWLGGNDKILLQVLANFNTALAALNLTGSVSLIIPLRYSVMGTTFPPLNSSFLSSITEISTLLQLLDASKSPFAINLYTYTSENSFQFDPTGYLNFLTFRTPKPEWMVVPTTNALYSSQFELEYDSVLQAVRTAGYPDMRVIVTETGWPTQGTTYATNPLAQAFTYGLASFLQSSTGTPLCPKCHLEVYTFELYDEPNKDLALGSSEPFFGISTYSGGKIVPKFPFNVNCNNEIQGTTQVVSGARSKASLSFVRMIVESTPRWPLFFRGSCHHYERFHSVPKLRLEGRNTVDLVRYLHPFTKTCVT